MLELASLAAEPPAVAALGPDLDATGAPTRPLVFVDTDSAADLAPADLDRALARLRSAYAIVVAVSPSSPPSAPIVEAVDISIAHSNHRRADPSSAVDRATVWTARPLEAVDRLREAVRANPVASLTLAWLLRCTAALPVGDGLAAESAAYSMLLAGKEFAAWLAKRGPARPSDGDRRVTLTRHGDELSVVLDRPSRRNAVDAAMRDGLREALALAEWDDGLRVTISGSGPSFSAGGDLDEFGSAGDPPTAHLVRVAGGVGAVIHRLRDRVTIHVHGVCMGAGVELPAFAARVVAAPDTRFALPEIAMGLIPGAGGTVSIPARIGRHRTLWLALTGHHLDAPTALAWGLIDAVE